MKIAYEPSFLRMFKKLPKDLQAEAKEKIEIFTKNPKDPSLKMHKLKGKLKGLFAFSINYSYRIIFDIIDKEAVLLEIGDHDVYR